MPVTLGYVIAIGVYVVHQLFYWHLYCNMSVIHDDTVVYETFHILYDMRSEEYTLFPRYGILNVDPGKDRITFEYYAAFADEPFDTVDVTSLIENSRS